MKWCPKCKTNKDWSEFSRSKSTKEGLQGWCKECHKKESHDWYLANSKLAIEHSAKWRKDNPERAAKSNARHSRKYRIRYPEKAKARAAVRKALADGRLTKEPCHCGETNVQGHHKDYSKPLDVEWLCSKHHIN